MSCCSKGRFSLEGHMGETYNHVGLDAETVGFLFVTDCGLQIVMSDARGLPHTEKSGRRYNAALGIQRPVP